MAPVVKRRSSCAPSDPPASRCTVDLLASQKVAVGRAEQRRADLAAPRRGAIAEPRPRRDPRARRLRLLSSVSVWAKVTGSKPSNSAAAGQRNRAGADLDAGERLPRSAEPAREVAVAVLVAATVEAVDSRRPLRAQGSGEACGIRADRGGSARPSEAERAAFCRPACTAEGRALRSRRSRRRSLRSPTAPTAVHGRSRYATRGPR